MQAVLNQCQRALEMLKGVEYPQGFGDSPGGPSHSQCGAVSETNEVFKSGPLFISVKGIGWTSWKKRWFILTRTSLVFFRNDPEALPQRGDQVNLTLGGIDLNNSGSVVVRADKKLLTVFFPDGQDGRAFTLKAETSEDMYEWRAALENALAQAPSASFTAGKTGILHNYEGDSLGRSCEQCQEGPVKSLVIGSPGLLALEDADGNPTFLEKALRFIEECGISVEGVLRQSADVEEVEHRVQEYVHGKDEFSPDEDAHVVADCIKHFLRALPSSPVPVSCCSLLLEAFKSDLASRVSAMRSVVDNKFPEPNRRLLQRILKMMRTVVSHKSKNRMSTPAVAACMAPLLLRPLLAGDCHFEDDFCMAGDGSVQLLQAAAAANHAQAIIIVLLEEYQSIFMDESTAESYSDTDNSYTDDEEFTDDEISEGDDYQDEDICTSETGIDPDRVLSGGLSESSGSVDSDTEDDKKYEVLDCIESTEIRRNTEVTDRSLMTTKSVQTTSMAEFKLIQPESPVVRKDFEAKEISPWEKDKQLTVHDNNQLVLVSERDAESSYFPDASNEADEVPCFLRERSYYPQVTDENRLNCEDLDKASRIKKSLYRSNNSLSAKRPAVWGRTSARKNLSVETISLSAEDELLIQKLESNKVDLEKKLAKEVEENAVLQASLERRKEALHEHRLTLEQDVMRLQEQLQRERELRATLKAGLRIMPMSISAQIDDKTRAELTEIALAEAEIIKLKEKVSNLHLQLSQECQDTTFLDSCGVDQHLLGSLSVELRD